MIQKFSGIAEESIISCSSMDFSGGTYSVSVPSVAVLEESLTAFGLTLDPKPVNLGSPTDLVEKESPHPRPFTGDAARLRLERAAPRGRVDVTAHRVAKPAETALITEAILTGKPGSRRAVHAAVRGAVSCGSG
jgi:hypothetical protein